MTKRARPRFRASDFPSGKPFIVLECLDGADLDLFKKFVGFDLPDGTSIDEAEGIARYLRHNLIWISET
jgi:hypothetical protein